jgi:hypothetical protein
MCRDSKQWKYQFLDQLAEILHKWRVAGCYQSEDLPAVQAIMLQVYTCHFRRNDTLSDDLINQFYTIASGDSSPDLATRIKNGMEACGKDLR